MTTHKWLFEKRMGALFAGRNIAQPMHGISLTIIPDKLADILFVNPMTAGGVVHSTQFQMCLEEAKNFAREILQLAECHRQENSGKTVDDGNAKG